MPKKHLDKFNFESILQLYKTKSTRYYQTAKRVIAPEIMECTAKNLVPIVLVHFNTH